MGAAVKSIPATEAPEQPRPPRRIRSRKLFEPELVQQALKHSFVMLRPDIQWANPVMFVVEIGAVLTFLFIVQALSEHFSQSGPDHVFYRAGRVAVLDGSLRKFCDRARRGTRQGPG